MKDDSDNIHEVEYEECVDCSKLSVISVTLLAKGKENVDSTMTLNNDFYSTTKDDGSQESVVVRDITNNTIDNDDDSCEKETS